MILRSGVWRPGSSMLSFKATLYLARLTMLMAHREGVVRTLRSQSLMTRFSQVILKTRNSPYKTLARMDSSREQIFVDGRNCLLFVSSYSLSLRTTPFYIKDHWLCRAADTQTGRKQHIFSLFSLIDLKQLIGGIRWEWAVMVWSTAESGRELMWPSRSLLSKSSLSGVCWSSVQRSHSCQSCITPTSCSSLVPWNTTVDGNQLVHTCYWWILLLLLLLRFM